MLRPPETPLGDGAIALRRWRREDAAAIVAACQDPEIARWTRVPSPYAHEDALAFLQFIEQEWAKGTGAHFAIVPAPDGEVLGSVGVNDHAWPVLEVGYWIDRAARGRRVATRAVRLIAQYAFAQGAVRLELRAAVDNLASQGVAERAGFTREGVLRQELELKGRRSDCVMFSLLPSDL